ncbi:hypothetical protein QJQ45_009605 [Haematococcus lacustris]|nr:hypothetical protein QJQ45_009605 [Haematococcus lacustris]
MWCSKLDQATPGGKDKWVDRDCNSALNLQRIGEAPWRPLELCRWQHRGAAPAKDKEYPASGFKMLRDRAPKAQAQRPVPCPALQRREATSIVTLYLILCEVNTFAACFTATWPLPSPDATMGIGYSKQPHKGNSVLLVNEENVDFINYLDAEWRSARARELDRFGGGS